MPPSSALTRAPTIRTGSCGSRRSRRWLEHEHSERRLLDLETVTEILTDIDIGILSVEMSRFLDQSAAYNIADLNEHTILVIEFMRKTEALDASYVRFARLLQHPLPRLRRGAVYLVREFDRQIANRVLSEHVATEHDPDILRSVVAYLRNAGIVPSLDVAERLLARRSDWMTAAWAIAVTPGAPATLLLGDGTDFARDMERLIVDSGFRVIDEPDRSLFLHDELDPALLKLFQMIVVIRGENYFRSSDDHNYDALAQYVRDGGLLFMTPWGTWETVQRPFAAFLPFRYMRDFHNEGIALQIHSAPTQLAQELFPETFTFEASYEELSPRRDTTVLLYGNGGVPLYGFRRIGQGECHYLNVCQHHCDKSMKSPLQADAFSRAMTRIWRWLYGQCSERAKSA
jgi:hypothetical protein